MDVKYGCNIVILTVLTHNKLDVCVVAYVVAKMGSSIAAYAHVSVTVLAARAHISFTRHSEELRSCLQSGALFPVCLLG